MGARKGRAATRIQVYLHDPKLVAALKREARSAKQSVSEAAGHTLARGMQGRVSADPQDRLLQLERRLSDHMRLTSRDLQIIEEILIELARALFARLPDSHADEDPTTRAAVERRIERLLDRAAAGVVKGRPAKGGGEESGEGAPLRAAE